MTRLITIVLMYAVVAVASLWDIYAFLEPTPNDTISKVAMGHWNRHCFLPYAVGVLIGHVGWTIPADPGYHIVRLIALVVISGIVGTLDLHLWNRGIIFPLPSVVPVLYGIIVGRVTCPQVFIQLYH